MDQSAIDMAMMRRCIGLSATAPSRGDLPIAALVCDRNGILAEATNQVRQETDVTAHAELIAIRVAMKAMKVARRKNLSGCTLYSTIEPCPMCSFAIRETRVDRVVYAIASPVMGGVSKWNVLRDHGLSKTIPEVFGPMPEIVSGLLWREAAKVWWKWNPFIWGVIRYRGCFGPPPETEEGQRLEAVRSRDGWFRSLLMLRHN